MYYYRGSNKNDYGDDIRNLNNKIDIVYSLLENVTKDRNDLLVLFNSRINSFRMKIFLMKIYTLIQMVDLN